jgi:predicted RNase H-like HicB family nuclease
MEAGRPGEPQVTQQYAVVIEQGESSYGAWVPDLPGCVAAASTAEEVERLIREAIVLHLEGLAERGDAIPVATTRVTNVAVPA